MECRAQLDPRDRHMANLRIYGEISEIFVDTLDI